MLKKRGAQSWSFDLILAFVVFLLIIGILFALLNSKKDNNVDRLELGASTLSSNIDTQTAINKDLSVIDKGSVDKTKIEELYGQDYESLKQRLGIQGDFCIYIVDQNGYVIPVNGTIGYGNGNLTISGVSCGTKVS